MDPVVLTSLVNVFGIPLSPMRAVGLTDLTTSKRVVNWPFTSTSSRA